MKDKHAPLPWGANDHGEMPGGICCQRAAGKYCYEHDPDNYPEHEVKTSNFLPGPGYVQTNLSGNNVEIIAKRKNGLLHKVAEITPYADGNQNAIALLYNAAYNSYLKNCGDKAMECALRDLLGKSLTLLKKLRDCGQWYPSALGIDQYSGSKEDGEDLYNEIVSLLKEARGTQ